MVGAKSGTGMVMAEEFIWLIGGSEMSVPMCKEIKRRGYKLLLTDGNPVCYCKQFADLFHTLNVYDVKANLNFARSLPECLGSGAEIAAVLTIGTDAGPTVSALSDFLDLPSVGQGVAEMVKDKASMRLKTNFAHPRYIVSRHLYTSLLRSGGREIPDDIYPAVAKPVDQAGSRGIETVYNKAELDQYIKRQKPNELLLEELLIGKDVIPAWRQRYGVDTSEAAFDFFIEDGEVIYANGALRLFWTDQPTIEAGHINPFVANVEIMQIARQATEKLGVTWGPFKIDVKQDRRYGWCLLECASRLSGGYDHMYTSPLATGKDITGVMLDVALGGKVDRIKLIPKKSLVACSLSPRYEEGYVSHWHKPARAAHLFITKEKQIPELTCNQDRPAFVIGCGGSRDEAISRTVKLSKQLWPVYEEG